MDRLRNPVPHPNPGVYEVPVKLLRQTTPFGGISYCQTSFWEDRFAGQVQRTTIEKTISLTWEQEPDGHVRFIYTTSGPILCQSDLSTLEKALLLLTKLYRRLEIETNHSGQLLGLHNYAEVLHTWHEIKQELIQRSGGNDEVTQLLIEAVAAQLQQPTGILASLCNDYAFGFALPSFYGQRFESNFRYETIREFPHFFADTSLHFKEHLEIAMPVEDGRATVRLIGTLDTMRTDVSAVAIQIQTALAAAAISPVAQVGPESVAGHYEATYDLDLATGWPIAAEVSVRCGAGEEYQKEYFLRLEQLPTL